jgi:hypothetical protein
MAQDLLRHPFSPGANATVGSPYLFRWFSFLTGTFTVTVALLVIARVHGNIIGPLLLIFGIGATGWSNRMDWVSRSQIEWFSALFTLYFYVFALPALIAILFYFPSGSTYPAGLQRWLPVFFIILCLIGVFASMAAPIQSGVRNPLYSPLFASIEMLAGLVWILAILTAIVAVIFRYQNSGIRERLQMKWVIWLGSILVVFSLLTWLYFPQMVTRNLLSIKALAALNFFGFIFWQGFAAVAFGFGILRHKLWDIDIIIRRTLVYGLLTATLVLIFFGGVTLLQSIFQTISGEQSLISIVLSTLAIAALFNPLRLRIQNFIDRRFYRSKYDAQKMLERYTTKARNETDFEQLSADLVAVAQDTMQPEHTSLWIIKVNSG